MREHLPTKKRILRKIKAGLRPAFVFNRKSVVVLTLLVLLASLVGAWRIKKHTQAQLQHERELLANQDIIPFEKRVHPSLASKELALWQSSRNTRAIAKFKDSYFAATDGGLVELDTSGNVLRHYSVLDGLPESDLLCLATFNSKLFIGTRTQGLVSFDGARFESYAWTDRASQAINALLEDAGRLLIGTMAGGLIEFDGRQFKEVTVGATHRRVPGINYLSKSSSRLYVGTFADGLWMEEGARWAQFTVADGLLSDRIIGVVEKGENLFVASDYGLAVAPFSNLSLDATKASPPESFRTIAILPTLSSIVEFGPNILLCKDNGESFTIAAVEDSGRVPQVNPLGWNRPAALTGSRLTMLDRDLWLFGSNGVRRAQTEALEAAGRRLALSFAPFGQTADAASLTTNLISALTVDAQGRLWAGGFRDGIDVFNTEGRKLAHLESETVREINSLAEGGEGKTVLAATSQGLLRFDANLRAAGSWSKADGLLSSSVMQAAWMPDGGAAEEKDRQQNFVVACATSKGLSMGVPGGWRGLTTVQGLPSNSLYTVLLQGRRIYAGTLNGLALVEDGRVVRVFKDTNSNLTHNWVTALRMVGSRLFVGTYGGGVFELTPAGELHGFQAETGSAGVVVVNPNAMWSDGARLYVGTLDGALVFDLRSQKWKHVVDGLPSRTVLSIAGDENYTYFGTTSGILRVERAYWDQAE